MARSTEARQYARPGPMVACASVPSPSAHVPPVVVGTSEPPSTENFLPLSRSMTVATFGLVSSSSAATTTAYSPSISASVMRYRFGALIVAGRRPVQLGAGGALGVGQRPRPADRRGVVDRSRHGRPLERVDGLLGRRRLRGGAPRRPTGSAGPSTTGRGGLLVGALDDGLGSARGSSSPAQPARVSARTHAVVAAQGARRIRRRCSAGSGRGWRGSSCRRHATARD